MMVKEAELAMAESIDRLMCLDMASRGIIHHLYMAARQHAGNEPLSYQAAARLKERLQPTDKVIIVTGWIDQPLVSPNKGESDGPSGAVALARALHVACRACPIIMVDECLAPRMQEVAEASGFECVPPENLHYAIELNRLRTVAVIGFPRGHEQGKLFGLEALRKYSPAACISIERGGMNSNGIIHNMLGANTGTEQSFMDYMFNEARRQGIFTLAIGDGGNELGMGNIQAAVQANVPHGAECTCGCGGGIAAASEVDLLVTAAISNWGAYAVAAMMAVMADAPLAFQTPEEEERILETSAKAGFHDGMMGFLGASVDGCPLESHKAIVTLMRQIGKL